jgi:Spy/CpxP family protein refolding chaperone
MWLLCSLAALALVVAPALAKEKEAPKVGESVGGEKPKMEKTKSPFGQYAPMIAELKLTDEQKQRMQEVMKVCAEELAAWQKDPEKGGKMQELQKAMGELNKAENKEKIKALGAEMKTLWQEMGKIQEKHEAAVVAVLTPEQQAEWKGLKVYLGIVGKFGKIELSEDQKTKIKALCADAAKEMEKQAADMKEKEGGKGEKGEKSWKGMGEVWQKLQADVAELLTPEQKAKLEEMRKEGGKEGSKKPGAPVEGKSVEKVEIKESK